MRNINKAKRKMYPNRGPYFCYILFLLFFIRPRLEDTEKGNLSVYKRNSIHILWST